MKSRLKGFSDLQSNIDSAEASEVKQYLSKLKPDEYKAAIEELRPRRQLDARHARRRHRGRRQSVCAPRRRRASNSATRCSPIRAPRRELTLRDAKSYAVLCRLLAGTGRARRQHELGRQRQGARARRSSCAASARRPTSARRSRASTSISRRSAHQGLRQRAGDPVRHRRRQQQRGRVASPRTSRPASCCPTCSRWARSTRPATKPSFTSYGPTVKVHANGYQVESVPGGERVAESGTSMASPQVANLAAKILAVNPKLTPTAGDRADPRQRRQTPDGRRTLINPKKALAAARRADRSRASRLPGLAPQSTSLAKSASRERSPRASVTWPPCGQPLKRSTAIGQARAAFGQVGRVDLRQVAQADDLGARAGARDQRLHLLGRQVLRLVDDARTCSGRCARA